MRLASPRPEIEAGQTDPAHVEGGPPDRRILARHRAVADHHAAIADGVGDATAGLAGDRIDAEPDRRTAGRRPRALGEIGPVFEHDIGAERPQFCRDIVAAHDIDRAHPARLGQHNNVAPDSRVGDVLDHPIAG